MSVYCDMETNGGGLTFVRVDKCQFIETWRLMKEG